MFDSVSCVPLLLKLLKTVRFHPASADVLELGHSLEVDSCKSCEPAHVTVTGLSWHATIVCGVPPYVTTAAALTLATINAAVIIARTLSL